MKTTFTILIFILSLANAKGQFSFTCNGLDIKFVNAHGDDFEALIFHDTTYVGQLAYEGLEGTKMIFSKEILSVKVRYKLGFLQYTIDDNPATPLEFRATTEQIELRTNRLPYFYNKESNKLNTHYLLGYQSIDRLRSAFVESNYLDIKSESISYQNEFYSSLLKDKRFKDCCPEYLIQAKEFLKSEDKSFETIEDLQLEFTYLSTILDIKFRDEAETKNVTIIIQ